MLGTSGPGPQERTSRGWSAGSEDLGGGLPRSSRSSTASGPTPAWSPTRPSGTAAPTQKTQRPFAGLSRRILPARPANLTDPAGWDGVGLLGAIQYAGFTPTAGASALQTIGYHCRICGLTVNAPQSGSARPRLARRRDQRPYRSGLLYVGIAYEKMAGRVVTDGDRRPTRCGRHDSVSSSWRCTRTRRSRWRPAQQRRGPVSPPPCRWAAAAPTWCTAVRSGVNHNLQRKVAGYGYPLSKRVPGRRCRPCPRRQDHQHGLRVGIANNVLIRPRSTCHEAGCLEPQCSE